MQASENSGVSGQGEQVGWIFLDLNSYFASVEQQVRAELRGRPIAVVPVMAETTCCIAVSYEGKAYGISTGTGVKEAKRLCPDIEFVEARHELYVEFHHKIVKAVDRCVPVQKILSIDEMSCKLMGRQREISNAWQLAVQIKQQIKKEVGETLRCSVGIAPNRFLAKVASDMQKPDGLTVIRLSQLPSVLYPLKLRALPGVGPRMERRLKRQGILTMQQLYALSSLEMGAIWGSVVGERYWHWLRGADFEESSLRQSSISHQHVLPPNLRTKECAEGVIQKLISQCSARLRKMRMWTHGLSVYVSFSMGREKDIWECHARIMECQDSITVLEAFHKMWKSCPDGKPTFVGVTLYDLIPDELHTGSLFEDEGARYRLSQAIDGINAKYGSNTVYLGGFHRFREAAPRRIAFASIPEFDRVSSPKAVWKES